MSFADTYSLFRSINSSSLGVIFFLFPVVLALLFGSPFIKRARTLFRAPVREYTPETHKVKAGTPSMGGLFIIVLTLVTIVIFSDLSSLELWLLLGSLIGFGIIGLLDDVSKIVYSRGISERSKFIAQLLLSGLLVSLWYWLCAPSSVIRVPFLPIISFDISFMLIPWSMFIIIGTSNAVNLTDGLDGLASSSLILNFLCFAFFAPTQSLFFLGLALAGSCTGFLYYNRYPAQIFMGDVGSLALGATLGFFACIVRHELLLVLTGCLFVLETISVMLQVIYYKYRHKRFLKRAPIHHHFELLGWPETRITFCFTLFTGIGCLVALGIFLVNR